MSRRAVRQLLEGDLKDLVGAGSGGGVAGVSSFNTRTGAVSLTNADALAAIGFTPAQAVHAHAINDVTGLQGELDGKQPAGSYAALVHSHAIANVTGLQDALDGKQAAGSYASAIHSHAIADVTGLQGALDGKAASAHAHAIADVTGLQLELDGKQAAGSYAAAVHAHAIADVTGLQGALDGKAASAHTHDDRYYTESEVDTLLAGKQAAGSYQPLDADLTAIAALTTTAFGRGFLDLIDGAAGRTKLGLGSAALSASGDFQAADSDLAAIAALTTTAYGRSLLTLADAAALTAAVNTFTSLLKGQVPASGGGTANFLRADGTWAAPPSGSGSGSNETGEVHVHTVGQYIDTSMSPNATTLAGVAGRMHALPFRPSTDTKIDQIGVDVTTGVASALVKIAVYTADATTGGPGALVFETGTIDVAAAGFKFATQAYTFLKGVRYWIVVRTSSTAALRSVNAVSCPTIGRAGATGAGANLIQRTLLFATAAPNPFGAIAASEFVSAAQAMVIMRLAA